MGSCDDYIPRTADASIMNLKVWRVHPSMGSCDDYIPRTADASIMNLKALRVTSMYLCVAMTTTFQGLLRLK